MSLNALVEQAIFTSARTRSREGYHLVARSPGVTDEDARALSVWGPAHDSLACHCHASGSINFHALPSGTFCVSRSSASGFEYSNRGGKRVYTQCLILDSNLLSRFSSNPFRVVEAATASGHMNVSRDAPGRVEPFRLLGRASVMDRTLLDQLALDPGPLAMATLVQALLSAPTLAIQCGCASERVLAGLISLLPPTCRRETSLSTGLRYSPRRPFRVITTVSDAAHQRRMAQQNDVTVFDIDGEWSKDYPSLGPWARFIRRAMEDRSWDELLRCYGNSAAVASLADLDNIEHACAHEAMSATVRYNESETLPRVDLSRSMKGMGSELLQNRPPREAARANDSEMPVVHDRRGRRTSCDRLREAIGRNERAGQSASSARQRPTESGSLPAKLETLDGAVVAALNGVDDALHRVIDLWPEIRRILGPERAEQSRSRYLQLTIQAWRASKNSIGVPDSRRAAVSLELLCLLYSSDDTLDPSRESVACDDSRLPM